MYLQADSSNRFIRLRKARHGFEAIRALKAWINFLKRSLGLHIERLLLDLDFYNFFVVCLCLDTNCSFVYEAKGDLGLLHGFELFVREREVRKRT